jgi:hypothetical protein
VLVCGEAALIDVDTLVCEGCLEELSNAQASLDAVQVRVCLCQLQYHCVFSLTHTTTTTTTTTTHSDVSLQRRCHRAMNGPMSIRFCAPDVLKTSAAMAWLQLNSASWPICRQLQQQQQQQRQQHR